MKSSFLKGEWKWLIAFLLLSILLTGLMTEWRFTDIDVQLHDTYFVIHPFQATVYLTIVLWTIKNFYLLVDVLTARNKILALIIAIIAPVFGLFGTFLLYMNIQDILIFSSNYPEMKLGSRLAPAITMVLFLCLLTAIEVKSLKRAWTLISGK